MPAPTRRTLTRIYKMLYACFGPQRWWPARTRFEVMVGAILTQNTNWGNVEKAIRNLKRERLLEPGKMRALPAGRLAGIIRPSGYYNIKTRRLKNFVDFLSGEYDGRLQRMTREPLSLLREKILSVNGIGPETADSILLYALQKPVFVVDAYTQRICRRHRLIGGTPGYHELQKIFMDHLNPDPRMFNEYHALLVRLGKEFCRPKPLCRQCPLNRLPHTIPSTHASALKSAGFRHGGPSRPSGE